MSSQYFQLLDQADEDALHYARLLSVEERPFQRITKRLLAKDAMTRRFPAQLPTPPPDASTDRAEGVAAAGVVSQVQEERERAQWRDDLLLDFQALESTLMRVQLLKDSNERERQRYAAEKSKILETAQAVRENTSELRVQLVEAQRTLALRKEYDQLAEKIVKNDKLKSRDEQASALEKLNAEIAELEQEGREYGTLWADRRSQFTRVVEEGKSMIKLIRGEKDEEEDDEQEEGDASDKGGSSRIGTPRPEAGDATPLRQSMDGDDTASLGPNKLLQRALGLGVGTPRSDRSRAASPMTTELRGRTPVPETKDTEMDEADPIAQIVPATDELEEGEEVDEPAVGGEEMDTT